MDGLNLLGPEDDGRYGEPYRRTKGGNRTDPSYTWPPTTEIQFRRMVHEAYGRADRLQREVSEPVREEDLPRHEEEQTEEVELNFENTFQDCVVPLYEGSRQNRLQAGIVIMTLSTVYGVSDNFLSALLTFLAGTLLPQSNNLPCTAYELKTMIRRLGLEHERIHCCLEGHILYEGEQNEHLTECPDCGSPRYVPGSTSIPRAVMRYFPLITKLKRIYKCPKLAELLNHYAGGGAGGTKMTSVADSHQWKEITRMYPEFADVGTHLRMALIADGVCPHRTQSSKHSTWVILIAIYNFPGWLTTKNFFLNLTMLIPGPKSPTSDNIDIYLKPLARELLELWHGVSAVNMSKPLGSRSFVMKGILMWTVHDFPAYGLVSGQTVKGYVACPVCGAETCSEYSRVLTKMIYMGSRRYLNPNHRFRRSRSAFNNNIEDGQRPRRRSGIEILEQGRGRASWLRGGGVEDSDGDPVKEHGVKRASILFALPYWKVPLFFEHFCKAFMKNM